MKDKFFTVYFSSEERVCVRERMFVIEDMVLGSRGMIRFLFYGRGGLGLGGSCRFYYLSVFVREYEGFNMKMYFFFVILRVVC